MEEYNASGGAVPEAEAACADVGNGAEAAKDAASTADTVGWSTRAADGRPSRTAAIITHRTVLGCIGAVPLTYSKPSCSA